MTDSNNNGSLQNNETVAFTVVKGTYTITSAPNTSNTVIEKVVWEPGQAAEDEVLGTSGVLTGESVAASETKLTYNFEVHVVGSSLSLSVTDKATNDGDSANDITVKSGLNDYAHDTKSVEHYYHYIDKKLADVTANDTIVFPLKLENEGNMDMNVAMDVFYFAAANKGVLNNNSYYSTNNNWEGTGAVNTPVFTAGSSTTANVDVPATTASGEITLTLSNVMATGTKVPAKAAYGNATNPAVDAATLTLGTDAWSKDSGAFVFRFKGTSTAGTVYVYYVLDLTIDQQPIQSVATQVNGDATAIGMPGEGDKLQAKGYDDTNDKSLNNVMVKVSNKPDQKDAFTAGLTDDDVHFAWVSVPKTETADKETIKGRFSVNASGALTTSYTGYQVKSANANSKEYTLTAADMDRNFYLIAYAPNTTANKTNAVDKAISDVIQAKRTVGVEITLNGNTQPVSGTADPGYVVFLVEQGGTLNVTDNGDGTFTTGAGTWATTWNGTERVYQAPIDLTKTYEVYAPSYKDGTNFVNTDKTLGFVNATTTNLKATVPYFAVTHTPNMSVVNTHDGFASYLPGSTGTGKAANAIQNALSVAVSDDKDVTTYTRGDKLPAPTGTNTSVTTPVLAGMSVKVTVDATKASGNATAKVKSWSETGAQPLHTLSAMVDANSTNWTSAATGAGIAYAAEISSSDIAVDGVKNFAAKLEQKLFDVTFVVKDNTPANTDMPAGITPKIESATLKPDDTGKEPNAGSTTWNASSITNGGVDGAVVTFQNVPAGAFEVAAVGGQRTIVDGYTWNATDLTNTSNPGKIVNVTSDGDVVNKHAGNTIQIQYGSNSIKWWDNFDNRVNVDGAPNANRGGTLPDGGFVNPPAFNKTGDLALTQGYSTAKGDVLTYIARVENNGAMPLSNFTIGQTDVGNLIADLTQVTVYNADGTPKDGTTDVTQLGFTLGLGEMVEFEVTIPGGKLASAANYTSTFAVSSTNDGSIAGGNYMPQYQVKPVITFKPGTAMVLYGGKAFEAQTPVTNPDPKDIAKGWDLAAYDPTFVYSVLTEDEVKTYLGVTTLPGNVYYNSEGDNKMPDWLALNTGTGAVTFDDDYRATDVNVQTKGATDFKDYEDNLADKMVPDEIVLYVKAVIAGTDETYYTTFTVNVEPGQLEIVGDSFTPADPTSGRGVDKDQFTYTNVVNQIVEDVVPATAIADGKNTAEGNTTAKDGTVNVASAYTAKWSVNPGTYQEGPANYTFTVEYKPLTGTEKWNYKPASVTKNVDAHKPPMSLMFADIIVDADDVRRGDDYSPARVDTDPTKAPEELEYDTTTYRKGEYVVYLDTEPSYTVKLQKIGTIYDLTLTEDSGTKGFAVDGTLPSFVKGDTVDEDLEFTVNLTALNATTGLWVGEHKISFTAAGYSTPKLAEAGGDPDVVATYELVFTVQPKIIAQAHVTDLTDPTPGGKPDTTITVAATDPEGEDIKPNTPDRHGNTPIDPKVEWTDETGKPVDPTKEFEDGKDYTATVTLTADPNYIYEDKAPEGEEPNYTAGDKAPDEDYDAEVTHKPTGQDEAKEKVTLIKETPLPKKSHLEFEDVNALNANDKVPHSPIAVRQTITVEKGQSLDKYLIKLGAYDNTVTGVTVTELEKMLPGGYTLDLTAPDSLGDLYQVQPDTDVNKTIYTLDLTGVDTRMIALGSYNLKLEAKGEDPYGNEVVATYELTIQVVKAPTPTLMFDDVNRDNERDKTGPAVNDTRRISTTVGGQLGRYTINLGSYDGITYNMELSIRSDIPSDSIYRLGLDCTATKLVPLPELDKASNKNWTFAELDLSDVDTAEAGTYTLTLEAKGVDVNGEVVKATYTLTIQITQPGGGGGGGTSCPNQVTYLLGLYGTTNDPTMEMVSGSKVKIVPNVNALAGYKFLGWSLNGPTGNAEQDAKRTLTDPKAMSITGDTTFYAVYQIVYAVPQPPIHKHYVIGYPNGNFGPADNIDRASVATIIARAVLPNFVEGADYGNPGGYTDVNGHWAASAIAYCSKYGVFNGYEDGTFKPNQPISRQELALVMARLNGVQTGGSVPFTDIGDAGTWAVDGIYTAYINGWVNGYTDGTFKPVNPIRRDETVKIFNAYLGRGVNAEGLEGLTEYVHTGVASNNTEDGTTEYMTWPDVTQDQWAYYEIIEAANDHEFTVDDTQPRGYVVPEQWTKCWIDEKWRYHDDANDGGPSTVVSALLKKFSLAD
ncbi:MAG: S-layer homology domain-containing protein [Muribaculaceae bacterium]|nr:S-layer homology domain-containing protein [Muribaculaceae bacterium]